MATRKRGDSFPCPHCGAEVPAGATFCRACGASDDAGWNDESAWTGGDDDDFDYDDYVGREFPEHAAPGQGSPPRWFFTLIAALVCLGILLWALRGG